MISRPSRVRAAWSQPLSRAASRRGRGWRPAFAGMTARGLFSSSFRVGPQVRKEAVRVLPGQNLLPPRCARGVLVVSPEVRADPAAKGLGLKGGCPVPAGGKGGRALTHRVLFIRPRSPPKYEIVGRRRRRTVNMGNMALENQRVRGPNRRAWRAGHLRGRWSPARIPEPAGLPIYSEAPRVAIWRHGGTAHR